MIEPGEVTTRTAQGDFVRFWHTGEPAQGEFRCADCGYGIAISRALPSCPMCGGESWEAALRPAVRADVPAHL